MGQYGGQHHMLNRGDHLEEAGVEATPFILVPLLSGCEFLCVTFHKNDFDKRRKLKRPRQQKDTISLGGKFSVSRKRWYRPLLCFEKKKNPGWEG